MATARPVASAGSAREAPSRTLFQTPPCVTGHSSRLRNPVWARDFVPFPNVVDCPVGRKFIWLPGFDPGRHFKNPYSEETDMTTSPASRVLIADDNQQNCELLDAYLADESYEIAFAHDGAETLAKVAEFQPDLILLDIMMPKFSGYEVCKQLRQAEAHRSIPILMITALNEMGDIEKAIQAGADDFLTKPVHRLELLTRVRSLLRVRHLTNERDRLLAYLDAVEGAAARER